MADKDFDERMMARALSLAARGAGRVSPNPLVGAVIAREGRVLAEGWHRECGALHAEAAAIAAARKAGFSDLAGATLYCSLEPCCYRSPEKRQPPCTEAILGSGIFRVVVANRDPNPRVDGKGLRILREAGVAVEEDVLASRGEELNEAFFRSVRSGRPFVHLKLAQSLDGRVAAASGDSKWITDERARREVHRLRASCDAVLVGSGTVAADDPELSVRLCPGRDPLRVALSSRLEIPLSSKLLRAEAAARLIVFRAALVESDPLAGGILVRERALELLGVRVFAVPLNAEGGLDLSAVLDRLHAVGVRSVLVEGGPTVFTSFVRSGLYDKVSIFAAPLLIGEGRSAIGDLGVERVSAAPRLKRVRYQRIGDQMLIRGYKEEAHVHRHR